MSGSPDWKTLRRPIDALMTMSKEQRNRIRLTLNFDWPDEMESTAENEAKIIIDHNLNGIITRLENRFEQLNPFASALSWRQILIKVIEEHLELVFPADASEKDLEIIILDNMANKGGGSNKNKGKSIPTKALTKLHKKAGLVLDILNDINNMADDVLGTTKGPAIAAVYAICRQININGKK